MGDTGASLAQGETKEAAMLRVIATDGLLILELHR
jgi:hypothetical protein